MNISHIDLAGSSRSQRRDAKRVGSADLADIVDLTITVRGKEPLIEPDPRVAPMSIEQIEGRFGADPADIEKVSNALRDMGFTVVSSSAGARTVQIRGPVAAAEKAFSVDLGLYESPNQPQYRGREGGIRIPAELSGIVTGVFGLDQRQVAKRRPIKLADRATPSAPAALAPQTPAQLESRYSFPAGTAQNQRIGILEFGGGYWESDLQMYCSQIANAAMPTVTVVPVGLQSLSLQQIKAITNKQQREMELDSSGEVNMDVQIVAGLCPGAEILVYFAPFTQSGWINVLKKAIHDPNGPKVISVSWGNPEDAGDLSPSAIQEINSTLQVAALAGVTICVSSGDDGAGDAVNDGLAHLDFPSSSPYVLAVGGTMIGETETGWWDSPGARTAQGGGSSGGGRSTVFPTPSWQNVPVVSVRTGKAEGRCTPDVSALSGSPLYALIFDGQTSPNGGTSASAPLWASLLARIAGNLPAGQALGFLTPRLYASGADGKPLGASVTTDITQGENSVLTSPTTRAVTGYEAGPGYDAVTGWGVPIGTALQAALAGGNSLSQRLFSGQAASAPAAHAIVTHDPFAAMLIEHSTLDDLSHKAAAAETGAKAWTDVPFPAGTAPSVLADAPGLTLPSADAVLITYTTDEANAMAALLTPGFMAVPPSRSGAPGWTSYTNQYESYVPDLLPGKSPALDSKNLGLYKLIQIGAKRVVCFKSSLHLATDGKSIPLMRLTAQICQETGAKLVITTGTAGGIGSQVVLGDAAITTACRFDLVRLFSSEPYNGTTVRSSFQLSNTGYVTMANQNLIAANAGRLASSPIPPTRTPQISMGSAVFGSDPNVCVTTDGFLYDDAENTFGLQGLGCMVEMDDACIGMAVNGIGPNGPQWCSIRNASDPQMPSGATKTESSDIYAKYGFYTTFTSVLACWAVLMGS